ncbi:MAG: hypothetical protein H6704_28975 [Myxococcales bacterium]|nr:hypothetical protein [Myxococcales bacterium]
MICARRGGEARRERGRGARTLALLRRVAHLEDALADHAENGERGLDGDDARAMLTRQLEKTQRRSRRPKRDAREARVPRKYLEPPAGAAAR